MIKNVCKYADIRGKKRLRFLKQTQYVRIAKNDLLTCFLDHIDCYKNGGYYYI